MSELDSPSLTLVCPHHDMIGSPLPLLISVRPRPDTDTANSILTARKIDSDRDHDVDTVDSPGLYLVLIAPGPGGSYYHFFTLTAQMQNGDICYLPLIWVSGLNRTFPQHARDRTASDTQHCTALVS